MSENYPAFGRSAFHCPRCGALAHQTWYEAYSRQRGSVNLIDSARINQIYESIEQSERDGDPQELITDKRKTLGDLENVSNDPVYIWPYDQSQRVNQVPNIHFSKCFSCKEASIWIKDQLLFPSASDTPPVNPDLPDTVKKIYSEASDVAPVSPPAAAALLRLSVEKLLIDLGGSKGKSLNSNISSLFQAGIITEDIKRACDIIRIHGNDAIHVGNINLDDERKDVFRLFHLINHIGLIHYTNKNSLDNLYANLSEESRSSIDKRDKK